MHVRSTRRLLRSLAFAASLLCAGTALAGPPLLCHPFDTAGAPSLPWGGASWRDARADYDLARLVDATTGLLGERTPVIARMETLRRAAIYAAGDGSVARRLMAQLESRIAAASTPDARAGALFDAGYYAETLQELLRLQAYDMPGVGHIDGEALRAILAHGDGSERIAAAIALRPDDASMRFAAALVASADRRPADYAANTQRARAGARGDHLLALNLRQLAP